LVVCLEVEVAMGVEEEGGKLMARIQSSWELSLEEGQEAATVAGGEDRLLGRISQVHASLALILSLEAGAVTAATVDTTVVTTVDTTMVTTMDTITDTTVEDIIVDTTVEEVDTTMEEVDTTLCSSRDVNVTTD